MNETLSSSETLSEHIESKPTVCAGKPCVAGTRIRVQDIHVWHNLQGLSADEIASRFPQLTLGDIYAALAYYWDHRQEIQQQLQEETDFVESLKRQRPSPLQEKLAGKHAADDPVSS